MNTSPTPDTPPCMEASNNPRYSSGMAKTTLIGLFTGATCILILVAVCEFLRLWDKAGGVWPSSPGWYLFVISSITVRFAFPILIAGISAALARHDKKDIFVIVFCAVTALTSLGFFWRISTSTPQRAMSPVKHDPGAQVYRYDSPRFSFDLPEGFEGLSMTNNTKGILGVFIKKGSPEKPGSGLVIEKYDTMLPKSLSEKSIRKRMPSGTELTLRNWRGKRIYTYAYQRKMDSFNMCFLELKVPLKPRAIGLTLAVPVEEEKTLSAVADRLLDSLDGETNW